MVLLLILMTWMVLLLILMVCGVVESWAVACA